MKPTASPIPDSTVRTPSITGPAWAAAPLTRLSMSARNVCRAAVAMFTASCHT